MTLIRLNKYLSDCGISSRRKSEEYILQGRVSINNKSVSDLSSKVDPANDIVLFDGEKVFKRRLLYFLLNKPKGVITTTNDEKNRQTVIDLIKSGEKIFPVGRLDYNTTGVLILTNDGEFSNFLTHPANKIPREYEVKLDRPLTESDQEKLCKSIYIKGVKGKFNKVVLQDKKNRKLVTVTASEGRNHFVKNMFRALGYTVTALNRKSFAGITADIPVGAYRILSKHEISGVINTYGK
jgi:23S rRNA pseudouridine2605 synthase